MQYAKTFARHSFRALRFDLGENLDRATRFYVYFATLQFIFQFFRLIDISLQHTYRVVVKRFDQEMLLQVYYKGGSHANATPGMSPLIFDKASSGQYPTDIDFSLGSRGRWWPPR